MTLNASEIGRHAVKLVNRHGKRESRPSNDGPAVATAEIGPAKEFYVKREGNDVLVFREGKKAFGARLNPGWEKDDSKILEHDDSISLGKSWASRFMDEV